MRRHGLCNATKHVAIFGRPFFFAHKLLGYLPSYNSALIPDKFAHHWPRKHSAAIDVCFAPCAGEE